MELGNNLWDNSLMEEEFTNLWEEKTCKWNNETEKGDIQSIWKEWFLTE